jgi:hypothetical protein
MKISFTPFKYWMVVYRREQFYLPAGFLFLFVIIVILLKGNSNAVGAAKAFLGAILPLMAGILAAYAVLDDPALELQFSTPRPVWYLLVERLGTILAAIALIAAAYQVFLPIGGIDLSDLGSLVERQLAWLVPTLAMIALGTAVSFALSGSTFGALFVGGVWIFEVILRGWFATNEIARYVYLFMGIHVPEHPWLHIFQASLFAITMILLWTGWLLLRKQEKYI